LTQLLECLELLNFSIFNSEWHTKYSCQNDFCSFCEFSRQKSSVQFSRQFFFFLQMSFLDLQFDFSWMNFVDLAQDYDFLHLFVQQHFSCRIKSTGSRCYCWVEELGHYLVRFFVWLFFYQASLSPRTTWTYIFIIIGLVLFGGLMSGKLTQPHFQSWNIFSMSSCRVSQGWLWALWASIVSSSR
jgi:hypothetical protein